MNCEFCNASFSSLGNLKSHKKTAKYCLKIQEEYSSNVVNNNFICDFCSKTFNHKHVLNDHYLSCKEKQAEYIFKEKEKQLEQSFREKENNLKIKYKQLEKSLKEKDRQLEELKKMNEKLQDTISEIALKSKTINNTNTTNNIVVGNHLNLNDVDRIQNVLDEHLDGNVLCNGQKGLAKMIYEKLLIGDDGKTVYKCVDPSRHNFEYIDEEGKVVRDVKASKLTTALIKGDVCQKAMDVGNDMWKKEDGTVDNLRFEAFYNKVSEVANIDKDDSKFRSELSALTC